MRMMIPSPRTSPFSMPPVDHSRTDGEEVHCSRELAYEVHADSHLGALVAAVDTLQAQFVSFPVWSSEAYPRLHYVEEEACSPEMRQLWAESVV